ncbi:hypothetical protein G5714_002741 [Onychostoma macrolepis]|uniref:Uncharacterized protein n=1 Tax=Onychostoma macrolepis TaxID=369639 RepID=A0A7J6D7Y2_9TELE|nr:hypothetical protein G5714_002741 [Onychostoma macrolepis]
MDIEQLQDRLSAALLQLRLDQLHEVCVYEKLSVEGQSKRHSLIRLISEAVENVIDTEDEDVARQHVKDLLEFSSGITQRSDRTIHDGGGDADRNSAELAHLKKHPEKGKEDAVGVRNRVEVTSVIIVSNVGKVDIFPEDAGDHLQEGQKEDTQLAV